MFRKIIRRFNNFKRTATFTFIFSILTALYGIAAFACYNFAGDVVNGIRDVGFESTKAGKLSGMFLFLFALIVIVIAVIVAYNLFPAVKNKEKVTIKKGYLLASFIGSIFELVLCIFTIALLLKDEPKTSLFILASLPLFGVTFLASIFELVLFCGCDFYMPEIERK